MELTKRVKEIANHEQMITIQISDADDPPISSL
jgi:hypothetical protein